MNGWMGVTTVVPFLAHGLLVNYAIRQFLLRSNGLLLDGESVSCIVLFYHNLTPWTVWTIYPLSPIACMHGRCCRVESATHLACGNFPHSSWLHDPEGWKFGNVRFDAVGVAQPTSSSLVSPIVAC